MIGKAGFEKEVRGIIRGYKSKINEEEMAEILWKLANQMLLESIHNRIKGLNY